MSEKQKRPREPFKAAGVYRYFDDAVRDLEAICNEIEREFRFDQKVGKENE